MTGLLPDADNDKSLVSINLMKKKLQTMKGFGYADREKMLLFAGLSLGPQSSLSLVVLGGDVQCIMKPIACGTLGSVEESKVQVDVGATKKTGRWDESESVGKVVTRGCCSVVSDKGCGFI